METGVDLSRALQSRYTLSETLDYLYLNAQGRRSSSQDLDKNTILAEDFIQLLYAVKQEFYVVDSHGTHWISPTLLMEMDNEAFATMINLTDCKYGMVFSKLSGKILAGSHGKIEYDSAQIWKLKTWMARILLNIRKLNLVYAEMEQNGEREEATLSSLNYNVWTYTSKILSILTDNHMGDDSSNSSDEGEQKGYKEAMKSAKLGLERTQDVLEIYREIDRLNYAGALDRCLSMLESFYKEVHPAAYFLRENPEARMLLDNLLHKGRMSMEDKRLLSLKLDELAKKNLDSFKFDLEHSLEKSRIVFTLNEESYCLSEDPDREYIVLIRTTSLVRKLGAFFSEVSQAPSSKDLSQVVEKFALPPASYKIKKAHRSSLFLNAYVGPYLGYESLVNTVSENGNRGFMNGLVYGISAPIGISYSFLRRPKSSSSTRGIITYTKKGERRYLGKSPWSLSLTLIDIGAVVSYRISNTDSSLPHEFKWEQFISPGIHVSKGLGNTPLVASFGLVHTPTLRRLEDDQRQHSVLRAYLGLFFDIPIGKIYSNDPYHRLEKGWEKN